MSISALTARLINRMDNFWLKIPKPIIALAPMAGVTDSAFRQMCKLYGADVIYTEFASSYALVYDNKKTRDLIAFTAGERPVVVQIFGRDPEIFFKAVKILEEMGFDGIDINFGCPAYKIVKTGGGVSLMRNLNLCRELVQAAGEGTRLPISIKIRASIKRGQDTKDKVEDNSNRPDSQAGGNSVVTALDLVNKIKNLPVAAIMIHGRSFEQPFDGEPNMEIISEVRKVWPGVLIANGGIYTPEKANEILTATGADGVGLARGAWGKPWLFRQVKDYFATGRYETFDWPKIKPLILQHARLALATKGPYGIIEFRKHMSWYVKGWPGASRVRQKLVQTKTIEEVEEILQNEAPRL